jgi:phosphorylase kinase alpha/beta subunit
VLSSEDVSLLAAFVKYFESIQFWQAEDSGHWEEAPKIEASSIGPVTAGLIALRQMLSQRGEWSKLTYNGKQLSPEFVDSLIEHGQQALGQILPSECIQEDSTKRRRYDAALLFLIYPLDIASGPIGEQIVSDVVDNLLGPYGIRRYIGDSYWCQDYKKLLAADQRTAEVSDDMSKRDSLLVPGQEAQWCIFDPIVSIIHGQHFQKSGDTRRLALQTHHLNRSLQQLTGNDTSFAPLRCPESWYCEGGKYVPNDITPLLWTQANLRLALHAMGQSVKSGKR